jgi:hypothetical protein
MSKFTRQLNSFYSKPTLIFTRSLSTSSNKKNWIELVKITNNNYNNHQKNSFIFIAALSSAILAIYLSNNKRFKTLQAKEIDPNINEVCFLRK